ncbi:hypothetical protein GCM10007387_19160 [Pseudoduganella albidiflava]|uniref:Uncharacterized protein n=2 Tax=Pseudoduganella albidiflava TaxID=321983 RepID=A0AA87XWD0_9BURK|nr:hypothetical protein GCM10007387_19160 [Pseudoduganella albidiflava]
MRYAMPALVAGLLAACAAPEEKRPAAPPPPPAATTPAPAPAPPPAPVIPSMPMPEPVPSASAKELADEAKRLTGMQKKYFSVFKIDEAGSGLKARDNAIGVYDLRRPPRGNRLRLVVTQPSSKPARLAVGTYNVSLDTVIDYVETQTCKSASCAGKTQNFVRSLKKVYRIQLSPRNQFYGAQDISLAAAGTPGNYRSTFSDVVVTVRRISVAPVAP